MDGKEMRCVKWTLLYCPEIGYSFGDALSASVTTVGELISSAK
jgi:hypothetical protein